MNISREWTCPKCKAEVAVVLVAEPDRRLSCPACWDVAPPMPEDAAKAAAAELEACERCAAPILPAHTAFDYCANCGASRALGAGKD